MTCRICGGILQATTTDLPFKVSDRTIVILILFTPSAERAFLALPRDIQKRLDKRLLALRDNPRPPGVKALTGAPGVLRLRVGDYRVLYEVDDAVLVVLVLTVAHPQYLTQQVLHHNASYGVIMC